jgi:hypothetical protein
VISKHKRQKEGENAISGQEPKTHFEMSTEELREHLDELASEKCFAWLDRPQVHAASFNDPRPIFRDLPPGAVVPDKWATDRERNRVELAKKLGWSDERLARFRGLVVAYTEDSSVENYVRIKHEFPEVEIQVGDYGGLERLFALEDEFMRQGIDPSLIAGSLDADEPSIDELCLRLLELVVVRNKLPTSGPGYIAKRREAISDATINYLIVKMLEAANLHGRSIRFPTSLVVLIREQLCAPHTDLEQLYLSRERFQNAAFLAGQWCFHRKKKKISVRDFQNLAGVGHGTADRWLNDKEFQGWFDMGRDFAAGEGIPRVRKPL